MHLVTGYGGKAHITADAVGAFNIGLIGSGEYVFNTGKKFAASVITSNTVRIMDGDLIMQGRHVTLKNGAYEELEISNGVNAMKRNDIIVARYTRNVKTGIEEVALAVVQGVSTDGTPSDPEITTGDIISGNCTLHEMPLWRIPITDLTVGKPVQLFKTLDALENMLQIVSFNRETGELVTKTADYTG
ncbi:Uncharacterised protein [uncultured Clostridium sp.]|nr:Uncharacterised protein [uncultured Clostridium sp.]